jgi:hypothetical protein
MVMGGNASKTGFALAFGGIQCLGDLGGFIERVNGWFGYADDDDTKHEFTSESDMAQPTLTPYLADSIDAWSRPRTSDLPPTDLVPVDGGDGTGALRDPDMVFALFPSPLPFGVLSSGDRLELPSELSKTAFSAEKNSQV